MKRAVNPVATIIYYALLLCAISTGPVFSALPENDSTQNNAPELNRSDKQKKFDQKQRAKQQEWCRANPKKCKEVRAQRREQRAKATRLCAQDPTNCKQKEYMLMERKRRLIEYIEQQQGSRRK